MKINYSRFVPPHYSRVLANVIPLRYKDVRCLPIGSEVFVFRDGQYRLAIIKEHDWKKAFQGENIAIAYDDRIRYIRPNDNETNIFQETKKEQIDG